MACKTYAIAFECMPPGPDSRSSHLYPFHDVSFRVVAYRHMVFHHGSCKEESKNGRDQSFSFPACCSCVVVDLGLALENYGCCDL